MSDKARRRTKPEMMNCALCSGQFHRTLQECPHCGQENVTVKPETQVDFAIKFDLALYRALQGLTAKRGKKIEFLVNEAMEQYITRELKRKAG